MNILFIAAFPILPNNGGVQRSTYTLAGEFENLGIKTWFLSLKKVINRIEFDDRQLFLENNDLNNSIAIREIKDIIQNRKIEVIINQAGIYKHVTKFLRKVKCRKINIITVHHNCIICLSERYKEIVLGNLKNEWVRMFFKLQPLWLILKLRHRVKYSWLFKESLKSSDLLVLLSDSFISELKFYIKSPDFNKIKSIPNPAPFRSNKEYLYQKENRIIYVGRLEITQKRVDRLLNLWKILHEKMPEWYFDIVGDGSARKWMEQFTKENNMTRINFYGFSNPEKYLKKAKFLTISSDFEGYGMVLVEAQAFGTIPVSFNCFSSLNEIIEDQHSGLIIQKFNEKEYITSLISVMRDEEKRMWMARNAQNHIKKFYPETIAKKWIEEINKFSE